MRLERMTACVIGLTMQFVTTAEVLAQSSTLMGEDGEIVITPLMHASAQVEYAGTVIQIDPWSVADLSDAKQADLILVTDNSPAHHFDPVAITALRKPGAPVILTETAQPHFPSGTVLVNGESGVYAGIEVEAIPAYDMTPGQPYHPNGEANGYVITLGGKRLFFAAVGECIPEIRALQNIDVAVMPMNLPVDRMRPVPVVECLKTFKPSIVYLNHYDRLYANWIADPDNEPLPDAQIAPAIIQSFRQAIEGQGIEFRDAGWYPPYPQY